jgi:squalene synthase HpnC
MILLPVQASGIFLCKISLPSTENPLYPIRNTETYSLHQAFAHTRKIAGHYENFTVGSLFFPKKMRQDLANIYAFCRVSDDLADEGFQYTNADFFDNNSPLDNLHKWESELDSIPTQVPKHPVLLALKDTISKYNLPLIPFHDLISAFKQDQIKTRYETFEELSDYCRRSANPVGRIYLGLFGFNSERYFQPSDKICTGLQLANFWQDISRDLEKGRIYIPLEDMDRFGYSVKDLQNRIFNVKFIDLLKFEILRTRQFFNEGAELENILPRRLAFEIKLFRKGGELVLNKIEKQRYNVLNSRPVITKFDKIKLLFG